MRHSAIIEPDGAVLVVVDVQDKLADVMEYRRQVVDNAGKLVRIFQILELPILVTEQYPRGMGRLVAPLREVISNCQPREKLSFSCFAEPGFTADIERIGARHLVVVGMEAHICILQTALDALANGYAAHVPVDAVCSRRTIDWQAGLSKMRQNGVVVTSTEIVIFELLQKAGTPQFKQALGVVK